MYGSESLLGLLGSGGGAASAGGAGAAGAGAGAGSAMTGLAGMGPASATATTPAFSAGGASGAAKGGSNVLGSLGANDLTKGSDSSAGKTAMDLMKLSASQRGGSPGGQLQPGKPGAPGTRPSVQQFLQMLAQRPGASLRGMPGT